MVRNNNMLTTQYFWGMVNGGNIDPKSLMGILKKVNNNSGTHELMVHPGINNTILGKAL